MDFWVMRFYTSPLSRLLACADARRIQTSILEHKTFSTK